MTTSIRFGAVDVNRPRLNVNQAIRNYNSVQEKLAQVLNNRTTRNHELYDEDLAETIGDDLEAMQQLAAMTQATGIRLNFNA